MNLFIATIKVRHLLEIKARTCHLVRIVRESFRMSSILVCLIFVLPNIQALLYPQGMLAIFPSISVPVTEYFPERVFNVDWCFVMNYNLPGSVSSFYNVPIWPNRTPREVDTEAPHFKYLNNSLGDRHHNDYSAGELYQAIEDILHSYNIHETCLLRAVCELAQTPFADETSNYLTELLTFLLSPVAHQGFDKHEQLYQEVYTDAEMRGLSGENCENLYTDCQHSLLQYFTKVKHDHSKNF